MIEKILKNTDINYLQYQISEKEKWSGMFVKSIEVWLQEGEYEKAAKCKEEYIKFTSELELIRKRIEELKSNSKRIPSNFPIIDVPASGNATWYGGAYSLYFVYSKYKGNFILRGWHKEVMEYLEKNYTHYFYNQSMWHNGICRSHWGFWKDGVTIFEPSKMYKSWKFNVVKYSATRSYGSGEREKELKFKRLPKRWIKEFDEL